MITPTITDHDEWNYLNSLRDSSPVGYPNSADKGYYARILQHKYPQCHVRLTEKTFQILQPGISSAPIPLTLEQQARQRLLDAFDTPTSAPVITKKKWLRALKDNRLLPDHT